MNILIKTFLNVNFKGRSGVVEYGTFVFSLYLFIAIFPVFNYENISFFLAMVFFIPFTSLISRRLHDVGFSGWIQLVFFIPVIGNFCYIFLIIILFLVPGENRDNEFGKIVEE